MSTAEIVSRRIAAEYSVRETVREIAQVLAQDDVEWRVVRLLLGKAREAAADVCRAQADLRRPT